MCGTSFGERGRPCGTLRIRSYRPSDCGALLALFYHTVHTVNVRDYTKEQLDAWATGQEDPEQWDRSLRRNISVVAVMGATVVGFGDMEQGGYLNRLYVHAQYQGMGIATAICDQLERAVPGNLRTHASITAVPFFERRGYRVLREQQVARHGVLLTNYVMEKRRNRAEHPGGPPPSEQSGGG